MNGTNKPTETAGVTHQSVGPDARIACLVPSITELCFDLGLGDQLVARTQFCVHPVGQVDKVSAVGGTKKINLEKLRALQPTHAILNVDENTIEMADAIRGFVPTVIITHPMTPEDNLSLYEQLGQAFDRKEKATEISNSFKSARANLENTVAGLELKKVLYLIWKDPWMTVSQDTYISALLAMVGWETLGHESKTRYPDVEITPDLLLNAELILFSSEPFTFTQEHVSEFAQTYGYPEERLLLIDGEYCSWYGSRAVAGMLYLSSLAKEVDRRLSSSQ